MQLIRVEVTQHFVLGILRAQTSLIMNCLHKIKRSVRTYGSDIEHTFTEAPHSASKNNACSLANCPHSACSLQRWLHFWRIKMRNGVITSRNPEKKIFQRRTICLWARMGWKDVFARPQWWQQWRISQRTIRPHDAALLWRMLLLLPPCVHHCSEQRNVFHS